MRGVDNMKRSSEQILKTSTEDSAIRCVLDVVCIHDPKERDARFKSLNKDHEALLKEAEKLVDETPQVVKETLTTFTKIAQRIKNSREKLQNLKYRLRVCKNTFSASFEKADTVMRAYLKSKECVQLLKKASEVLESSRTVSAAIADKNFVAASEIIATTRRYLKDDLSEIDSIQNSRLDLEFATSNLYKSIFDTLLNALFDENFLIEPGTRTDPFFRAFPPLPSPSQKPLDGWHSDLAEQLTSLVQTLKTINRLKICLAQLIKTFEGELLRALNDVASKTHTYLLEKMEISESSETRARFDATALTRLVSVVLLRVDAVHQKGEHLAKIFKNNLDNYESDWVELIDETLPDADPELFERTVNFSIFSSLKEFLSDYLTFEAVDAEKGLSESSLSTSAHHFVFSFKQRLVNSSKKGPLYRFSGLAFDGGTQRNVPFHHEVVATVCDPSVKAFKYLFAPVRVFAEINGGYFLERG